MVPGKRGFHSRWIQAISSVVRDESLLLLNLNCPRPANDLAWQRTGMLAVANHGNTINEHITHVGGKLMRLLVRCMIDDGLRIKHRDVGIQTFLQQATVLNG